MSIALADNLFAEALLRAFAASYNLRPALRRHLRGERGPLEFTIGFRTEDGRLDRALRIEGGKVYVVGKSAGADATIIYRDWDVVKRMLKSTPNELLIALMRNQVRTEGNLNYLSAFNYLLSLLLEKKYLKQLDEEKEAAAQARTALAAKQYEKPGAEPGRNAGRLSAAPCDNVKYLPDPYLADYSLADFPRIAAILERQRTVRPAICAERSVLLTDFFLGEGLDPARADDAMPPELRQGRALRYLMEHRRPLIHADFPLAGSNTTKEVGVLLYPDGHGATIWGELRTVGARELNPYDIEPADAERLHRYVFPYWAQRNFREWVRKEYDAPLCQRIDERFAVYFAWKTVALSHTIPDFEKFLRLGIRGIQAEVASALDTHGDAAERASLNGMHEALEGLAAYSMHLADEAARLAAAEADATRKAEFEELARICAGAPLTGAKTLHEAVQSMWILWIALHMENTNAGLSIGRMDQLLQPYFEAEMAAITDAAERRVYIEKALELCAAFFLCCGDHLPLVPDIGNYLFGGSSSDQAITLGGITPAGENAVNDMTFVLLKVTEILKVRDPNVNARFHTGKNSKTYLRRLCEVNLITAATPSIHGDEAVMRSLEGRGYDQRDINDWAATGCVEPTMVGKHYGHTGCMMFNLVAPLEMALNDGLHPLMNWRVGPRTGEPAAGSALDFESFMGAFDEQLEFLVDNAVEYNNLLGRAHQVMRPTPLLSSVIDGCIDEGKDAVQGGARYNSSGTAIIGLADVTDSLLAVKKLVYDEKLIDFAELSAALADDFVGHERVAALIADKAPRYGSGSEEARALAGRIAEMVHAKFAARENYRGGRYTTGFWSMSNHVAFGVLSGALPSGRRAGKAFTPGLTPSPAASRNMLDNLRDVAALDPACADNNIAFNVKYVPAPGREHARAVDEMAAYAKTYTQLGGMQMQLNVVGSDTLRDAMANPEDYRDLLVRISGYNAYFVELNRDMQIELIERTEFSH